VLVLFHNAAPPNQSTACVTHEYDSTSDFAGLPDLYLHTGLVPKQLSNYVMKGALLTASRKALAAKAFAKL
jgi:hypothetical protein